MYSNEVVDFELQIIERVRQTGPKTIKFALTMAT